MSDFERVQRKKEDIISFIKNNGPSLPVHVGKAIGVLPLFASAFLSELYAEKKIRISDMRVGSSPLYYIEGQEPLLEKFSNHLNIREREALEILKKEKVLIDDEQTPVVRVALRAIKDFAFPIRVRVNEDVKTFWKYFSLSEEDFKQIIRDRINIEKENKTEKEENIEVALSVNPHSQLLSIKNPVDNIEKKNETEEKPNQIKNIKKTVKSIDQIFDNPSIENKAEKEKKIEHEFSLIVQKFLNSKGLTLNKIHLDKKKEFSGMFEFDGLFGKQKVLVVAKDKKSISDNDLAIALQKAQSEKLPALFISPGALNKKSENYLKEWGNLVIFEKLNEKV